MKRTRVFSLVSIAMLVTTMGGCPDVELDDFLEDLEININQVVSQVQTVDPTTDDLILVGDAADTVVIIEDDADVIVDISNDLIVDELFDINLIGFENLTGFDIYLIFQNDRNFLIGLLFKIKSTDAGGLTCWQLGQFFFEILVHSFSSFFIRT